MSYSHIWSTRITSGSEVVVGLETVSADTKIEFSDTITAPQTNKEIDVAFDDDATLKSIVIYSPVACDLYTNDASTGAPDDHIALAAGVPFAWKHTDAATCPITAPVTKMYMTLGGTTSTALQIWALVDSTP